MAWESRIKNEKNRQIVVAVIMCSLLVLATCLGALMSLARNRTTAVYVESGDVVRKAISDIWSIEYPVEWKEYTDDKKESTLLSDGSASFSLLDTFELPSDTQNTSQSLYVFSLTYFTPHPSSVSINHIRMLFDTNAAWSDQSHSAPHPQAMFENMYIGRQRVRDLHGRAILIPTTAICALTTDGREHLVLYLSGNHQMTEHHVELISKIATSAIDHRFQSLNTTHIELGGVPVTIPGSMVALNSTRRTPDGPRRILTIVPRHSTQFFTINAWSVSLHDISANINVDESALTSPDKLVNAWLIAKYTQLYHRHPPDEAVVYETAGDTVIHALALIQGRQHLVNQKILVIRRNNTHVLILDVALVRNATRAAQQVLTEMISTDQSSS